MKQCRKDFLELIVETRSGGAVYAYLVKQVHPPFDVTDVLRWQIAQSVSALDRLIHDLVRDCVLEVFLHKRKATSKYSTFMLPIDVVVQMIGETRNSQSSILEREIVRQTSQFAYQRPENIADALSYFWDEKDKWSAIASKMGLCAEDVKNRLKVIVDRRNQIVHAGDRPSRLSGRDSVDQKDVESTIDFIEKLGVAICDCIP